MTQGNSLPCLPELREQEQEVHTISPFVPSEFWTMDYSKNNLIVLRSFPARPSGAPSGDEHTGAEALVSHQPPARHSFPGHWWAFPSQCGVGWAGDGYFCGKDVDIDSYPDEELPCSAKNCKKVRRAGGKKCTLTHSHTVAFLATSCVGEVLWVPLKCAFLDGLHLNYSKRTINNKSRQLQLSWGLT